MFAARVRSPWNMEKSMMGVLPVAISTIMVSPTARPRPIITAEKMPGLAVRITTRLRVCQGVAPSARDPWVRCLGTEKTASSAMEKMVGMTAKPMAIPTTRELRWSNLMPISWVSQMRESPCMKAFSMSGLKAKAPQPISSSTGMSRMACQPSGSQDLPRSGR
ncbi:hypothetical protein D3C71_1479810 [compost metagenome]